MASLNSIDKPVHNNYQLVPTNTTDVAAPTGMNDMRPAMGMGQTPSFGAPLPFCANAFGSSQGFFDNDISAVDYQPNFDPNFSNNMNSVKYAHNFDRDVFDNNISTVDYQHDSDTNVSLAGLQQTSLSQIPSGYPQSSGYAFFTCNPQFPASVRNKPLVESQQTQASRSQQGLPGFPQTQKDSKAFAIPSVTQTYRQAAVVQSLSNVATSATHFFRLDSLNEYNAFSTFAAAPVQQPSQNSGRKPPQPHQCHHNTLLNGGQLLEFESSTQKQGVQLNHCIKYQIPQTQSLVENETQQPVASSEPVNQGERQQLSAKATHTSRKDSTSTDLDTVLEEQPTAALEVIGLTDNDQVPTPTLALDATNAPKKDGKLFDNYVGRFAETGHSVQRQLYNHEQGKGVHKPTEYSPSEKEIAIGQNSKYKWKKDLAIENRGNEKGQGLSLPEQKTEAQMKREKNAEQRRKLKENKRARENAQKPFAALSAPAVILNLATPANIQTAPAQAAPTQIAPALTKEALEAMGPLTLAQSKQLWHPVEHAYMQWEPNQEDYRDLIRPGDPGNPMYDCAHEDPKCEVEPITCTHPCCRTGVPWKMKKDLLVKAARKLGDKEADKRGFPRPKHTRGAKGQKAPSTQPSAAPAPIQFSAQLTISQAADSIQAPIPVPDPNPKPVALSSGQLAFLQATNPSLFASLQTQLHTDSQATGNRSLKRQREEDEPSEVPRPKRTSCWTTQDRASQLATMIPSQQPAGVPDWENRYSRPEPAIKGLSKKSVGVSEPPKGSGGSDSASQDCEPGPAPAVRSPATFNNPSTQGVVLASISATGSSKEADDGEMDSIFDDDGLGSLFDDDGLGSLFDDDGLGSLFGDNDNLDT